jgi:hypothetical protein
MTKPISSKTSAFEQIETSLLKQEIAILKQEKILEREQLLKDIAHRLTKKNMAFPIIREIVDLPEQELRGIFYGGVEQRSAHRVHSPKVGGSNPSPAITQEVRS